MPFDATPTTTISDLPQFRPRRNQRRLDFRPVIWSLRNRPNEWELADGGRRIIHKPSQHEFWVASGVMFYNLHRADCSCSSHGHTKPCLVDRLRFHFAFHAWNRQNNNVADINRQFAAHFITPRT